MLRVIIAFSNCCLFAFLAAIVVGQTAPSVSPDFTFVAILERTGYIDLEPLGLTPQQQDALSELLREWEVARDDFLFRNPELYREWRRQQNLAIEAKLSAILTPTQIEWLVRDRNITLLSVAANRKSREGTAGSFVALEQVHELLSLSKAQRDRLKEIDERWGKKITDLRFELAALEDQMAAEYESKLRSVLDSSQRAAYFEKIGEPAAIAEPFTSEGRLKANRVYPRMPPSIIGPPRDTGKLSQAVLESISKRLVLSVEMDGDLILLSNQSEEWATIVQDLKQAIHPLDLKQVLSNLELPIELLEVVNSSHMGEGTRVPNNSALGRDLVKARELTIAASGKAIEILVPRQRQWLYQVSLQYYVAITGGKFPFRFAWIRNEVEVRSDQSKQMDVLLAEHDNKLNRIAEEYAKRYQELREQSDRELYDVLTTVQKSILASYIGPPKWEALESDK